MPIKDLVHLVGLWILLPLNSLALEGYVCTSAGDCELADQDALSLPELPFITPRATVCPASDCDNTGILEHHLGDESTINNGISAACTNVGDNGVRTTLATGFLRCFEAGICSSHRVISSVSFRVQRLEGVSGSFVTVNLYKGGSNSCGSAANVQEMYRQGPVATAVQGVSAGFNFLVEVALREEVILSSTESLLVEIRAPTLVGVGQFFVSDSPQQCGPSYLQGSDCGIPNPTPLSSLGEAVESVSYVISVKTDLALFLPAPPTTARIPTPAPIGRVVPPMVGGSSSTGCFMNILSTLECIFDYFFAWLWPF